MVDWGRRPTFCPPCHRALPVAAAAAAAKAFPAWSALGPSARRAMLLKAAHALEARTADFAVAMAAE
ncbi:aldehyde dehydrogenase family protein, partial [Acidovorax sp. SD340]|uniref:aldehyde dehydrogenase family protein n=1 Tax=Acidovorax sp. SD340 TaxID=1690268 RepID=UPI000A560A7D